MIKMNKKLSILALVISSISLTACNEDPTEQIINQAVAIEKSDGCHLCGMIIEGFPGPKGQLFNKTSYISHKFCSTRDLFGFLLQPENVRQVKEVYVHDMGKTPWQKPTDEFFINAKDAWFIIGSSKNGAMGETIASFSQQNDAKAFSTEFGGKLYRFSEITIDII
jgi:copper chaperone NosL